MSNKYKIIFFDADETLYNYKKSSINAFFKTLEDLSNKTKKHLPDLYVDYSEINEKLWAKYQDGLVEKRFLLVERFRILFENNNLRINPELFGKEYLENLSNNNHLISGAEEIIKKLSEKFILAIITNGVLSVQTKRFSNSVLRPYFSEIVVSGQFSDRKNFNKPNPEIFEYTHKQISEDISKNEILMVGDSLKSDIKGGINYGIDTCLYNPDRLVREFQEMKEYYFYSNKD